MIVYMVKKETTNKVKKIKQPKNENVEPYIDIRLDNPPVNDRRIILNKNGDAQYIRQSRLPLLLKQLGVRRVTQSMQQKIKDGLYNGKIAGSSVKIVDELKGKDKVNIEIFIKFKFDYSETFNQVRTVYKVFNQLKVNDISSTIDTMIRDFFMFVSDAEFLTIKPTIEILEKKITSTASRQVLLYEDMKLRETAPLDLSKYITNIECKVYKDCVRDYLKNKYSQISKSNIDKIGNKKGCTTKEIYDFCVTYGISMISYNIHGNIIMQNTPIKRNHNYTCLYFIAYDNHFYPLTSKDIIYNTSNKKVQVILNKVTNEEAKKNKSLIEGEIKNLNNHLNDNLMKNKFCYDINMNGDNVVSYICEDIHYTNNTEYETCKEILQLFKLEDKITPNTKLSYLYKIIETQYIKKFGSIDSFWPGSQNFVKGGYYHYNKKLHSQTKESDIKSIDNNKHYAYSLMTLPYLLKFDYRQSKINKNPKKIIDTNMYLAKPEYSSILLMDTNIYPGYHLKYCQTQKLKFELLEEIECVPITNFYTELIPLLYSKLDEKTFKDLMVKMIGCFELGIGERSHLKVMKIGKIDELNTESGYIKNLNDSSVYKLLCQEEKTYQIYTRKIIAFQVKDNSKVIIYKKMNELKLTHDDIIRVKTDAITYINKKLPHTGSKLGEWKIDFPKFDTTQGSDEVKEILSDGFEEVSDRQITTVLCESSQNKNNIINLAYAGAGKSYEIMKIIIKREHIKDDYIILSPSHTSLTEYRNNKLNCEVIQHYSIFGTLPKEHNIIIDEIGMIDRKGHDVIYKLLLAKKNIISYGDFQQLPPVDKLNKNMLKPFVDEPLFNTSHSFDHIYSKTRIMSTNYRNNFTKEYYDSIINKEINILKEVRKHSTKKPEDAETIICYRNDTVDQYNKIMMDKLKLKLWDKTMKVRCYKKALPHKNIYKNFVLTIDDINGDKYTLSNGSIVTKTELNKYFKPAYARTVHSVQGATLKSYYFAPEDDKFITNGNVAYTIISRLKQEIDDNMDVTDLMLDIFE